MHKDDRTYIEIAIAQAVSSLSARDAIEFRERMIEVVQAKSGDYASSGDTWQTFEDASEITGASIPEVISVLVAIKIGRIRSLTESGAKPNNESLYDTCIDAANYMVLLAAWVKKQDE